MPIDVEVEIEPRGRAAGSAIARPSVLEMATSPGIASSSTST
jgi:hypothetical protein